MLHRIYLTPGMFGFARLASFDYFVHVQHGLERQFADAGQDLEVHVVDVSPTASVCRRAARLAEVVDATAGDDGPIHLLGHSTGGLGDHLDVLGHYRDDRPASDGQLPHHDWLTSGSAFGPADFEALMGAVATGMLKDSGRRR
ncbi:hypothetical protein KKD52_18945 [Myxococcota bacterium]|nr:hypothetical protein [Myxococcota bacterium]MBU1512436.1 hypothetical protein [Myxococcota bacterium]